MFNLQDYETVEERNEKFWKQYPDGPIETEPIEESCSSLRLQHPVHMFLHETYESHLELHGRCDVLQHYQTQAPSPQ